MAEPLPLLVIPGAQLLGAALCRGDPRAVAIRARRDRRLHAPLEHGCDCGAHPRRRAGINLHMLHLNPPRHVSVHRKSLVAGKGCSTGPALRDPASKLRPCQVEHIPQDPKPIHSSPPAGSPDYAPRSEGTPAVKPLRNRTAIDHHGALWREIAEGMAFLSLPIAAFTTAGVGVVA
jgi:hypothetical protein